MQKFLVIFLIIISSIDLFGQELNCQVSINSQQVQGDKRRFTTLQTAVYEFMNSRQWTNRKFKPEEKIECSVFITFNSKSSGEVYSGSIQIQSRRPVFNSSYNSPMLNIKDNNLSFNWVEYDPLNFDINTFSSNLTSVLAYYAYLIIGTDFDSYSLLGGTEYFNNAQTIVNNAQSVNYLGWKSMESGENNRYWILENILNSRYQDYRTFTYNYHRLALDVMYDNLSKGRVEALKALKLLDKLHKIKPGLVIVNSLMDAKSDEFIGLFTGGQPNERIQAKNILSLIDPTNSGKYNKMNQGPGK
jgi:hypothetical protein